jgi:hypothetical protein
MKQAEARFRTQKIRALLTAAAWLALAYSADTVQGLVVFRVACGVLLCGWSIILAQTLSKAWDVLADAQAEEARAAKADRDAVTEILRKEGTASVEGTEPPRVRVAEPEPVQATAAVKIRRDTGALHGYFAHIGERVYVNVSGSDRWYFQGKAITAGSHLSKLLCAALKEFLANEQARLREDEQRAYNEAYEIARKAQGV